MGYSIYAVIVVILAFALQPKTPGAKPAELSEINVPTAEQGKPVPKVFGKVLLQSPNIVWYGDIGYNKIQGKGK